MLPPENSGELVPFQDHVLIYLKGVWKRQITIKGCNRRICWDLLTQEPMSKIHALERYSKVNLKGEKAVYKYTNGTWEKL